MKNVTVSLNEEVARWARVWAAEHNTSVSKMLGSFLEEKMKEEENYTRAKELYFSQQPKKLKETSESYPTRESMHER